MTNETAAIHSSVCDRVPVIRSLASRSAKQSSVNAPARLGSSARRRGAGARHQRAMITAAVAAQAAASVPRWSRSIDVRDVVVGQGEQQVRALPSVSQNSSQTNWSEPERERVGGDEPAVEPRLEPPAA